MKASSPPQYSLISTPLGISPQRSSAESPAPCPGSPAGQSWAWHLAQLVAWSWWQVSTGCRAGLQGFIHCSVFGDRLDEQERGYVSGGKSALREKLKAYSLISIKTPKCGSPAPPQSTKFSEGPGCLLGHTTVCILAMTGITNQAPFPPYGSARLFYH